MVKSKDQNFEVTQDKAFYVSKLTLTNFRNYSSLRLDLNELPVVITGYNGAGKTNILEAVSLLSPGRGIRKIKLQDADRIGYDGVLHPWSISSVINYKNQETQIGTARDINSQSNKRIIKLDGDVIRSQAQLADIFSVMWLTPQMDGLFIGSTSDRRRFLDRLVYNFDPEHASRIYSYEYTMRERAKLLQLNSDPSWISILEEKMAQRAVSIAAARIDAIANIQSSVMQLSTAFPKALIGVEGSVEELLSNNTALHVEQLLKRQLSDSRDYDAKTGRTNVGTHRSDFVVTHIDKSMPAASCSTGEQKALLLSIILAEAHAKAMWKNNVPVLLLDEVVAHLDQHRRISLFDELINMKAQVWMTGTDATLFEPLRGKAQFLSVDGGVVSGG